MKYHFEEIQKFNQWWLWAILIGVLLVSLIGAYKQVLLQQQFGSLPLSYIGLAIFALFQLGMLIFFRMLRLDTKIDKKSIRIQFWPFRQREIEWSKIAYAKVINYGFVGGWGIRYGTKYGTVYNVRGKMGLRIELFSGKKLCIGTQKPEELAMLEQIQ